MDKKTTLQITEEIDEPCPEGRGITIDDFVAYLPAGNYIYTPCREFWSGRSIDIKLGAVVLLDKHGQPNKKKMTPTKWLVKNRPVIQTVWAPGFPMLIHDRMVIDGGWIERGDVTIFNVYQPPRLKLGDGSKAGPWLEHVHRIYPDDAQRIIPWLAHRVQRPFEKVNHGLMLGGKQGIGKDSMLEPIKYAVGHWNYHEIVPSQLLGRFNSYAKSVVLRINEVHDLGDNAERVNKYAFYDRSKNYAAAPPDVLRVDEKHTREFYVFNCCGLVYTTNHRLDGLYLPADDRRTDVSWSPANKSDFPNGYWVDLWGYYREGGFGHVAAYLTELDISDFDPKAPPPKTPAFWAIVNAGQAPEDAELADVLDKLGRPAAVTIRQIIAAATGDLAEWITLHKNRRVIPHRLERCHYIPIRNEYAEDGYWRIGGTRQPVYGRDDLSEADRRQAATELAAIA
jgi:uncharacterized protein DUF5906